MQDCSIDHSVPSVFFLEKKEEPDQLQSEIDFQSKMIEDQEIFTDKQLISFIIEGSRILLSSTLIPLYGPIQMKGNLLNCTKLLAIAGPHFPSILKEGNVFTNPQLLEFNKKQILFEAKEECKEAQQDAHWSFWQKIHQIQPQHHFQTFKCLRRKSDWKMQNFIYRLIDFSEFEEENLPAQNSGLLEEVQDFILALIALENLFRIISGERVYKGKKKNIAYLKRFNFKLDSQAKKNLVISRQNCYIVEGPIDADSPSQKSMESIQCESRSQNEISLDSETNRIIMEESETQKTDDKTISFELYQKTLNTDSMSYTTDGSFPPSPYQTFLLDEEMREYEMFCDGQKGRWTQNLLDQYSGTKFSFNIEC